MPPPRASLLAAAQRFCDAFARKQDIDTILSHFSTKQPISAIEHGEPCLARFIGRPFEGVSEIRKYFDILSSVINYEGVQFSAYVVDPEIGRVSLMGKGRFTWIDTNQSWNEIFTYTLDFDEELKVTKYQVWADTGAAYLARIGELDDVRKE